MKFNLAPYLILAALGLVGGLLLGFKLWGTKPPEVREVIKTQTVTVTRETTRPDGTKVKQTRTIEQKEAAKTIIAKKPDWILSAGVIAPLDRLTTKPDYTLQAQRRILGPLFLGASISTNKTIGLNLGMEF